MKKKQGIQLPQGVCANLTEEQMDAMIDMAFRLEPLWENALGKNWRRKISSKQLKQLYLKM